MCKLKELTPMNCDVFCFEDISQKHFGNINITGTLCIDAKGIFKANDTFIGEDFIAFGNPLCLKNIKVNGNFMCEKCIHVQFTSLKVEGACLLGKAVSLSKKTPVDCDVFCIDGTLPQNVCITGNLYVANASEPTLLSDIEVGEDVFIESSSIKAYNIKSQGATYVYGKEKKAFSFGSFTSLEGCEIYTDIEE